MASYTIATHKTRRGPRAALIVDGKLFDAADVLDEQRFADMRGLLGAWPRFDKAARKWLKRPASARRGGKSLARVKLLAPVLNPTAIFCAGANYSDHVAEMSRALNVPREEDPHEAGLKPWHFIKTMGTLAGPGVDVELPEFSTMIDWEAELVAVIGKPARNVSIEDALKHVAGYTMANDLSARDHVSRPKVPDGSPFKFDWISQKSWEGSCPLGPWIVPSADVGDPQDLAIRLLVNGKIKQDSHTSKMLFTTAEQISHLSTRLTLQPGDLILTGTPAGVGMARREFLKRGDVVTVEIEKLGQLETIMR